MRVLETRIIPISFWFFSSAHTSRCDAELRQVTNKQQRKLHELQNKDKQNTCLTPEGTPSPPIRGKRNRRLIQEYFHSLRTGTMIFSVNQFAPNRCSHHLYQPFRSVPASLYHTREHYRRYAHRILGMYAVVSSNSRNGWIDWH
ncbi:hypothetical protein P167DRAFT_335884 [Morchella conica CCBAS932]|uniref:Uncharacterized protein n=1 Tax=Morchella conica CCBAS932 TaxID=1392247 RepID=A0A3N4KDN9_9PEZI|nr:hypothetical protein P167DRAFT_335884 [Morchella conica CCBAS932]